MNYKVSFQNAHQHYIDIEASLAGLDSDTVEICLPAWRPGRYELGNFSRNIQKFQVSDSEGSPLTFRKISKDKWLIDCAGISEIRINYNYFAAQLDAGACWLDNRQLYVNGVHLFVYNPERIHEPCTLELVLPADYHVASGMTLIGDHVYSLKDFHELVDMPFIASADLKHESYVAAGITFHLWFQGECRPDMERIKSDFAKFSELQVKMMGGAPFSEYHFLFQILPYKAYHGVEHLNNTVISLGPASQLMLEGTYENLLGVSCHELYHAWNVKCIRPVEMMPYRYDQENYSKLGYVAEGVTTYYGDLYLFQSGVFGKKQYFTELARQLQKHFDNYGRLNLSVAESSFDTWLDGYAEGIPNRKTSIYTEGCLFSFMRDVLIRKNTNNRTSLDTLMKTLYDDFGKKGIGYSEKDFRRLADNTAGISLDKLFDDHYYGTSDYTPMLTVCLDFLGLEMKANPTTKWRERKLGLRTTTDNGRIKVRAIAPGSPADVAGIAKDDEIVAVNGVRIETTLSDWLEYYGEEQVILTVTTQGLVYVLELKTDDQEYYPVWSVVQKENISAEQKSAFEFWALAGANLS